ncbi:hypothetical protein E2C01_030448 [Portunus trituberculatus]|uniref:Uncharacterized protein n=1 Tax=Portunus trituberculatus TaxID=210409 RepID=A0A5B7EUV8_PORTR|nr:hypothetical protein [Portunus trituberculatus]
MVSMNASNVAHCYEIQLKLVPSRARPDHYTTYGPHRAYVYMVILGYTVAEAAKSLRSVVRRKPSGSARLARLWRGRLCKGLGRFLYRPRSAAIHTYINRLKWTP